MISHTERGGGYEAFLMKVPPSVTVSLRPQDRPRWPGGVRLLTSVLSLLVIASVIYEIRGVDRLLMSVSATPASCVGTKTTICRTDNVAT